MIESRFLVTVVVAALLASACNDFSPVVLANVPDGSAADAGDGDGSAVGEGECRACVEGPEEPGPGCQRATEGCLADEKCAAMYECMYELGCFAEESVNASANCALPCAVRAGALTGADSSLQLGVEVVMCVYDSCAEACKPSREM